MDIINQLVDSFIGSWFEHLCAGAGLTYILLTYPKLLYKIVQHYYYDHMKSGKIKCPLCGNKTWEDGNYCIACGIKLQHNKQHKSWSGKFLQLLN